MKKVLLATTVLALTGTSALAEVVLSGSGRFGVQYIEDSGADNDTYINTRLRFNIDASTETASGVTFGGRIRLQYDNGDNDGTEGGAELSAAKLYGEMMGFRVEVGNVDTAYDSAALMYNSEIGFIGTSFGNPSGSYYSFDSGPFGAGEFDRMGVAFSYGVENFNVRLSYVDPDQFSDAGTEEISVGADYTFNQFTVSGAVALDGAGIDGNDNFFLGGQYALSDTANVGLLYFDNGEIGGVDVGNTITLYGNADFGNGVVGRAYVANNDNDANQSDLAFGIGADYDLGGATLAGVIHRGYQENIVADLGVKFDF